MYCIYCYICEPTADFLPRKWNQTFQNIQQYTFLNSVNCILYIFCYILYILLHMRPHCRLPSWEVEPNVPEYAMYILDN